MRVYRPLLRQWITVPQVTFAVLTSSWSSGVIVMLQERGNEWVTGRITGLMEESGKKDGEPPRSLLVQLNTGKTVYVKCV